MFSPSHAINRHSIIATATDPSGQLFAEINIAARSPHSVKIWLQPQKNSLRTGFGLYQLRGECQVSAYANRALHVGSSLSLRRRAGAVCDGVTVNPGDIVAADSNGVVCRGRKPSKGWRAQNMDFKEHSMYASIERL